LPQYGHSITYVGPKLGLLDLERLTVGLGNKILPEPQVNAGAEIGPDGVSSIAYFGTKGVSVTSAP